MITGVGFHPLPLFFVGVASKGFSQAVSRLFATLAGRPISVAIKGLKAIAGNNPDRVGAGHWTVVSPEKSSGCELEKGRRARMVRGHPPSGSFGRPRSPARFPTLSEQARGRPGRQDK